MLHNFSTQIHNKDKNSLRVLCICVRKRERERESIMKCKTYKFSHNFLSSANLLIYYALYLFSPFYVSPPH